MTSPLCLSARSSIITQQRLLNRGRIKSTDEASLTYPSVIRFLFQNPAASHCRLQDSEKGFRISQKGVPKTTPLMNAIRNGLVVKLLREKNTDVEKDAGVDDEGIVSRSDEKSLTFVMRVLGGFVNGFNAATNHALLCGLGIHGHACNPGEEYACIESDASSAEFDLGKDIASQINNMGLTKFFPADNNSGSMKTGTRIDSMISVTRQITSIATHLVPPDEGVHIRFLNTSSKEQRLYDTYGAVSTPDAAAEMVSKAGYTGVTKLGTILRKVILEPFIYQHLENNPVSFQINQIGNDPAAEAFLNSLRTDDEIRNHIFCASANVKMRVERLDEKFMELGEDKEQQEIWMYNMLMAPLVQVE
ncbi:hypothetical protein K440DRAFT_636149 [Wilcoxina mikolae CBS 423.85]|nr:hypothetical protein K440DRAFT_636149 [Wilcoxina mikolae CBS 423.85]